MSITSLPQAKVNLPHVHYRHDMGTTPISPSGKGKDVACGGEQEGCWGDWGRGALRGFFMQLCIAFMLSSQ